MAPRRAMQAQGEGWGSIGRFFKKAAKKAVKVAKPIAKIAAQEAAAKIPGPQGIIARQAAASLGSGPGSKRVLGAINKLAGKTKKVVDKTKSLAKGKAVSKGLADAGFKKASDVAKSYGFGAERMPYKTGVYRMKISSAKGMGAPRKKKSTSLVGRPGNTRLGTIVTQAPGFQPYFARASHSAQY